MDSTQADFYADASLYDILYTPGSAEEADLLERLARRHAPARRSRMRWLEPACGSGRLVRVLAARGHRVTGFDREPGMVAYARRRLSRRGLARRARVLVASMEDFGGVVTPGSIDVAFCTVNTFRHLLTEAAARRHFEGVRRALAPGGVYLLGISLADYEHDEPSEDVWKAARGPCRVRQIVQYLPPDAATRRETVYSHLAVRTPSSSRHLDSRYELRSYDEEEWKSLLRRVRFERRAVVDDRGRDRGTREIHYQVEVLAPSARPLSA